jgi:hypothetical protein
VNAVLADSTTGPDPCGRCGFSRQVWSSALRRWIRCTACTTVELPIDHDVFRRLARAERRRARNRVAVVVLETIAEEARIFPRLPPELITTDRVLDRWSSFGTGRPAANPDVYHTSMPPPLPPETQLLVSDLVRLAPPRPQEVTHQLYTRGAPASWVGARLGMKPRTFGRYWHDVLRIHRDRFLASGDSDLVSLIRAQP